jgi:hypothetical protein
VHYYSLELWRRNVNWWGERFTGVLDHFVNTLENDSEEFGVDYGH